MSVFWPHESSAVGSRGLLLGWVGEGGVVVSSIMTDVSLSVLENAIRRLSCNVHLAQLWHHTVTPPCILGQWLPDVSSSDGEWVLENKAAQMRKHNDSCDMWLSVARDRAVESSGGARKWLPVMKESFEFGEQVIKQWRVVLYDTPQGHSYYSQRPFTFDIAQLSKLHKRKIHDSHLDVCLRQINCAAKLNDLIQSELNRPLSPLAQSFVHPSSPDMFRLDFHPPSSPPRPSRRRVSTSPIRKQTRQRVASSPGARAVSPSAVAMTRSSSFGDVQQLECEPVKLPEWNIGLRRRALSRTSAEHQDGRSLFHDRPNVSRSPSSRSLLPPPSLLTCLLRLHKFLRQRCLQLVVMLLLGLRLVFEAVLCGVNMRLPACLGGTRVKEHSLFLQQMERRIITVCRWPFLWSLSHVHRRWGGHNTAISAGHFVSFWTAFWQVWMDVFAGCASAWWLRTHAHDVQYMLHVFGQFLHTDVLREHTFWLMGIPGGLKLNEAAGHTIGSMVLGGIEFWNTITTFLTPFEPAIVVVFASISVFGTSLALSAALDLLSLLTVHVTFVHSSFRKLYTLELSALSALWKLFRGKKHNVLRHRVDSFRFDMDQLMVGTFLFAIIVFLFPTLAVYFLFFSGVRVLVLIGQAAIHFILFLVNYFPFFAIGLFFVDKDRLPGGIRFQSLSPRFPYSHQTDIRRSPASTTLRIQPRDSITIRRASQHSRLAQLRHSGAALHVNVSCASCAPDCAPGACCTHTYLVLVNKGVSLTRLLFKFERQIRHVFRHYSPGRVLSCLLFGEPLPLVPAFPVADECESYVPSLGELRKFFGDPFRPKFAVEVDRLYLVPSASLDDLRVVVPVPIVNPQDMPHSSPNVDA